MLQKFLVRTFFLFLVLGTTLTSAANITDLATHKLIRHTQTPVLPMTEAFKPLLTFSADRSILEITWQIADQHYLYQDKIKLSSSMPISYHLPAGKKIVDNLFGDQVVYFSHLVLSVPLPSPTPEHFPLELTYQGCSAAGFCYPPTTTLWEADRLTGKITAVSAVTNPYATAVVTSDQLQSVPSAVTTLFKQHGASWRLMVFYGLGLLLAFTPCVLPMIPILSSIVLGQKTIPRSWDSFGLSLSYVGGMIITYTVAGICAGLAGKTLQSYLQTPWFIGFSAVLLILLAFNLFGCYQLSFSAGWNNRLQQLTQNIRGGYYLSAILLGIFSALIISPCVTAPLVGVLTYISTTGDAWLGGSALFALALGMGTPLLLIGTIGPRLLPQAGAWLVGVQRILGGVLIAVALWLISRVLTPPLTLAVWGISAIMGASYLGALQTNIASGWPRFQQAAAWIILLTGILLITQASQPLLQQWLPTTHWPANPAPVRHGSVFTAVKTWADIQQHLEQGDKPILLDIYADWCVSCKLFEQYILPEPQVQDLLQYFTLLRADITAQDADDRTLQRKLNVFAPPTLIFFTADGKEWHNGRLVGNLTTAGLVQHLRAMQANSVN